MSLGDIARSLESEDGGKRYPSEINGVKKVFVSYRVIDLQDEVIVATRDGNLAILLESGGHFEETEGQCGILLSYKENAREEKPNVEIQDDVLVPEGTNGLSDYWATVESYERVAKGLEVEPE